MNTEKKVMSAEEWFYKAHSGYSMTQFHRDVLMTEYANYILSQRIDELAERIAENAEAYEIYNPEYPIKSDAEYKSVVSKGSILKIANDFKTELEL